MSKEHLLQGRVVTIHPKEIIVLAETKLFSCVLRANLQKNSRFQTKGIRSTITIGDLVVIQPLTESTAVIERVEPRKSWFSRQDHFHRQQEQLIAANIDQLVIVCSIIKPNLQLTFLDRALVIAAQGKTKPIIVVNKVDLLDSTNTEQVKLLQKIYSSLAIEIHFISTLTTEGIELLKESLKDRCSVFIGQSGAGKSSLINLLANTKRYIGDLSKKGRGTHTTTCAEWIDLPFGGHCIDTPGLQTLGIWKLSYQQLLHSFSEIEEASLHCAFRNCSHQKEKNCKVQECLEKEEIASSRYDSFLTLKSEMEQFSKKKSL